MVVPVGRRGISWACNPSSSEALLDRTQCTSPRAGEVCKCRCCTGEVCVAQSSSWY